MDLTVDLPDSRGNLSFVWPLHEPVALINTGPPVYTDICGKYISIISDLKTKCRPVFDTFNYHLLVIILGSSKFRELQMTLFQDCDIFSLHVGIKVRVATILDSSAHPRESGERLTQPLQYLLAHPLRHLKKDSRRFYCGEISSQLLRETF